MSATKDRINIRLVAFLGAVCLFMSTIEYLIPKPIPFLRIGLANLPILIGLRILNPKELSLLVLLKILGQGLIQGTLFSYVILFSTGSSISSALVMVGAYLLFKKRITLIGVSVLGAIASNIVQLLLAVIMIFGSGAIIIAPAFLSLGLAASIFLGWFGERLCQSSLWYAQIREEQLNGQG